ncbi:unnamed protein product [Ixodes persulcatus]
MPSHSLKVACFKNIFRRNRSVNAGKSNYSAARKWGQRDLLEGGRNFPRIFPRKRGIHRESLGQKNLPIFQPRNGTPKPSQKPCQRTRAQNSGRWAEPLPKKVESSGARRRGISRGALG